jgi:protein-S-isoprenylcysteine O-methyltransferase Ste14
VLVLTLGAAAVGFAMLVIALMTGSVLWAWGCIAVCVVGAVLLLAGALMGRKTPPEQ